MTRSIIFPQIFDKHRLSNNKRYRSITHDLIKIDRIYRVQTDWRSPLEIIHPLTLFLILDVSEYTQKLLTVSNIKMKNGDRGRKARRLQEVSC